MTEGSQVAQARQVMQLARWAARAFAGYELGAVRRIVEAVSLAAGREAEQYARLEVLETGWGRVPDRAALNLLCSRVVPTADADHDFVSARFGLAGALELPRPVGVLLYLAGAASPVAGICHAVLTALLTRNVIVVSPDSMAGESGAAVVRMLADAAVAAGAPAGAIQVVEPVPQVREVLLADGQAGLVFDGGGDHANVPVLVDSTADLDLAAEKLLNSVAFDHSLAGGSESVLIVEDAVAQALLDALRGAGGRVLSGGEVELLRFAPSAGLVGRAAVEVAHSVGIRVPADTRVLLAPLDVIERTIHDEPLAQQKRFPVLGVVRVGDVARGIRVAATVAGLAPSARSAVIHSQNSSTVMRFAAAVEVKQVIVNDGGSLGGVAVNSTLEPARLITFTRFAGRAPFGTGPRPAPSSVEGSCPAAPVSAVASASAGEPSPVPPYPIAGNLVNR